MYMFLILPNVNNSKYHVIYTPHLCFLHPVIEQCPLVTYRYGAVLEDITLTFPLLQSGESNIKSANEVTNIYLVLQHLYIQKH